MNHPFIFSLWTGPSILITNWIYPILSLPNKESLSLSHLRESATKLAETDPGLVGPYVAAVIKELNKINQVGRDRINPVTNQEGHM